jgi:radical SAM protein (TIGR04043 family)
MNRSLPILTAAAKTKRRPPIPELLSELQAFGVRWEDARGPGLSRSGGAGPTDHKAITLDHQTVMVPILTHASALSPYTARVNAYGGGATLLRGNEPIADIAFPKQPRFYALKTADGIPYWKIATLHAADVLATTVLQTCTRYGNRETACQFCAIGKSLSAKSTIPEKTPAQLAEVARAAAELDGVKHVVLTTGTPRTADRGAAVLAESARAIKAASGLPIQAQCEPPADFGWFSRLKEAGVDSLGLHLEAVTERVRRRIMPGKAEVPVSVYFDAFNEAVRVFGRGQVSTYILAGLGDTREEILDMCERLVRAGVYPFVVPFVPISGTALEDEPPPDPLFLRDTLDGVAAILADHDMSSADIKAGCGRCGACSTLKAREAARA